MLMHTQFQTSVDDNSKQDLGPCSPVDPGKTPFSPDPCVECWPLHKLLCLWAKFTL